MRENVCQNMKWSLITSSFSFQNLIINKAPKSTKNQKAEIYDWRVFCSIASIWFNIIILQLFHIKEMISHPLQ